MEKLKKKIIHRSSSTCIAQIHLTNNSIQTQYISVRPRRRRRKKCHNFIRKNPQKNNAIFFCYFWILIDFKPFARCSQERKKKKIILIIFDKITCLRSCNFHAIFFFLLSITPLNHFE